ncbi:Anti-sigma regulatory factor (Ser/Thr protein kinase) [Devosia lucknowensis]|uniref:Anti-sigma regulatory factor (Ser/Thr protein kinase) n=1 Tax=Devosia lucknowensis TaxID=1096929 RepID=A0A1Y6GBR7_9HYPH|nr:ATP-binding protein [Devosia lucknowensis]SMQ85509.1 Anti-sigma regulatory factor (Ser/Thr protein kinase) [Devosia lucknowensis]
MPSSLSLKIDSDLAGVGPVARAVRALCSETLDELALDELELGVVEALNNVIKHGYAGQKGSLVQVRVGLKADKVVVEIIDRAPPMPQSALQPPDPWAGIDEGQPQDLPEGGMGLALIQMTMDEVAYSSRKGVNTLTLTKLLSRK